MIIFITSAYSLIRKSKIYHLRIRNFNSEVPDKPQVFNFKHRSSSEDVKVDIDTITHLERLSLVNFGNLKGIEILESAIKFSEPLFVVDTTGVKPLTTVLENR